MTNAAPEPLRDATRVVHAGVPAPVQGAPQLPGPALASHFHVEGDPATAAYAYGRDGNPTWTLYERALGELEGGPATVFASGMAAAAAVLVPVVRPGDVLVAPADGYPAVRSLATGHVAVADPARRDELVTWRTETGAIAGPFEVWLAHRSLATLALRLERQAATALALAERLLFREDVADVRYPGLPRDRAHEAARRQMRGFGSVVSFTVAGGRERAERFLADCRLVEQATSF